MSAKNFERPEKGQPIKAKALADPIAEIERLSNLTVAGGMTLHDMQGGPAIGLQEVRSIVAKITSGTDPGPFAWTEQSAGAGGTWVNAYLTGTTSADSAYNTVTGVTLTLPLIVPMWRADDGSWRFTAGSC